jgi:2-polyprenyl-3-methyl-5-hydroxy-6-metoxy-1,4-benzoquinol methylase
MEYFIKNNIISDNPILFYNGVRDNPNINVYKDYDTGAIVLDKINEQNYETKGLTYWNCENIIEAQYKTYDDDIRRYKQLKNINYTTLLDFGCGNGGLLKIIKKNDNKNIIGIELNKELVNYLNNDNITTYNDINNIPTKINFDCIMLNHVLEHLYDPIKTLKEIKNKMNDKTILIIEVPHANDFLINEYNCDEFKKFTFWSEHLILHTEKSLIRLLNIVGFSNIQITYYQRYNIFNHLGWLSNRTPGGHKTTSLVDDELIKSYDNFLIKNKKTDTLIAYCYI